MVWTARPEQGYQHTKFERPPLNSVRQNANVKVFNKTKQINKQNPFNYPFEYVQKWKKLGYIHDLVDVINNHTKNIKFSVKFDIYHIYSVRKNRYVVQSISRPAGTAHYIVPFFMWVKATKPLTTLVGLGSAALAALLALPR